MLVTDKKYNKKGLKSINAFYRYVFFFSPKRLYNSFLKQIEVVSPLSVKRF